MKGVVAAVCSSGCLTSQPGGGKQRLNRCATRRICAADTSCIRSAAKFTNEPQDETEVQKKILFGTPSTVLLW